jgi:E3 ubiquitin-protein ligase UBR1
LGRCGPALEDPAICMVCGLLLNSGSRGNRTAVHTASLTPGDCTIHAENCGGGVGVFFLVQKCCPLLIKGSRACYLPPIYLDHNGETCDTLSQSKPMHLSRRRVRRLEEMFVRHQLARELFRVRASSEKVIRQNWY